MINVGSVGQPRDGDRRACYVVLEDDVVRFRRDRVSVRENDLRRFTTFPTWTISSATGFATGGS